MSLEWDYFGNILPTVKLLGKGQSQDSLNETGNVSKIMF